MAIKSKQDKSGPELPSDLDDLCLRGFTFQQLCDAYEEKFKVTKAEVEAYLKTSDEFEVTEGEGFKTPYGTIIYSARGFYKYDNDAIIELVKKGKVSIEQILSCVSGFKAEELEKTLSSAVFSGVATKTETKSLTFRASTEFKAKVREQVDDGAPAPIAEVTVTKEKITMKVDKKQVEKAAAENAVKKKESAAEKAREAKAKLAAKKGAKKSASDDLDEILGKR